MAKIDGVSLTDYQYFSFSIHQDKGRQEFAFLSLKIIQSKRFASFRFLLDEEGNL